MVLLKFPIIKFTICLILGICIAHNTKLDIRTINIISIAFVTSVTISWLILRNRINRTPVFSILAYLSMICIGMHTYKIHDETRRPLHYSNLYLNETTNTIVFKIREQLKPDLYNYKYLATVISVNEKNASGKLLINISKDSANQILPVDALLYTSAKLLELPSPLNPHQFDYSKYLRLKQIYHQLNLQSNELFVISDQPSTIYGLAAQWRTIINKKLSYAGFKDNVLSIINALLLGQKQSIDKTVHENYANSGTIHILAVSGLHVGILTLILSFLFRPLHYFKYGYLLKGFIIVAILWLFAIIAGLSPSVTRAVTMFSTITVSIHLKRPSNIYNTLAISAFFILLFNPTYVFEVGFQMSYLAVLGIVSFQPIIYRLWDPKISIIDYFWQIFTVTIAAQIGVGPISLYYFHQFPGLFFISNLVVIPFLGLILGIGLLVILLSLLNLLHYYLVLAFSFIIDILNAFIAWIAQFEAFLFRDIPFTLTQVICSYLIVFTLFQALRAKTFNWTVLCLVCVIAFQSTFLFNKFNIQQDAFVVFNKSRHTLIGIKKNRKLIAYHTMDSSKETLDKTFRNYQLGEGIKTIKAKTLGHIFQFKTNTILVIDSLGVYDRLSFNPDYVLLRNSPRINLNRMIGSIHPKKIIADASNYKTYVKRWKLTCKNKKIPFHYTNEKGAFILK